MDSKYGFADGYRNVGSRRTPDGTPMEAKPSLVEERCQLFLGLAHQCPGLLGQPAQVAVESAERLVLPEFLGDGLRHLGVPAQVAKNLPASDSEAQLEDNPAAAAGFRGHEPLSGQGRHLRR